MRVRKVLVIRTASIALLLAAGAYVPWPRPDRITEASLDRIREGMSRAEVEEILGGPPGDYRDIPTDDIGEGPTSCGGEVDWLASRIDAKKYSDYEDTPPTIPGSLGSLTGDVAYVPTGESSGLWFGNDGYIQVVFVDKVVAEKDFWHTVRKTTGPIDNLLWRAKRQWHRWFPPK